MRPSVVSLPFAATTCTLLFADIGACLSAQLARCPMSSLGPSFRRRLSRAYGLRTPEANRQRPVDRAGSAITRQNCTHMARDDISLEPILGRPRAQRLEDRARGEPC